MEAFGKLQLEDGGILCHAWNPETEGEKKRLLIVSHLIQHCK